MRLLRQLLVTGALLVGLAAPAGAEGTETLGPPTVPVSSGSGIAVAGVGLFTQPQTLEVTIPTDATVEQVLLYFEAGHREGDFSGEEPDHTIRVNGVTVGCCIVGGPSGFYGDVITSTHRDDITDLGFVTPGTSTLTFDGLDIDEVTDGAGVVVIYSQPGETAEIGVRDGNDIAFVDFAPPLDTTAPQTFTFAPADVERVADLGMIVNSIHDPVGGQTDPTDRPNFLEITVAGQTTRLRDPFPDTPTPELEAGTLPVTIPAGADSVTVQWLSERDDTGDLPASLVWLAAALSVPVPPAPSTTEASVVQTTITAPPTVTTTGPLPFTGDRTGNLVVVGVGALAVGLAAAAVARRQRQALR